MATIGARQPARGPLRGRALGPLTAALALAALTACGGAADESGGAASGGGMSGGDDGRASLAAEAPAFDAAAPEAAAGTDAASAAGGLLTQAQALAGRGVVHTLSLTIEVDDVAAAAAQAGTLAEQVGGYVQSASVVTDPAAASSTGPEGLVDTAAKPDVLPYTGGPTIVVMRVPAERRGEVMTALAALGEVTTRSQQAQDVTDEQVDVASRIASAQRSIDRLRVLVGQAGTVAEVITAESELSRREADLEALQARQATLAGQVELATVTLTLVLPDTILDPDADLGFLAGLRRGWDAFASAAVIGVTALGAVVPFAVLGGLVALPVVLLVRRRAARAVPAVPPVAP